MSIKQKITFGFIATAFLLSTMLTLTSGTVYADPIQDPGEFQSPPSLYFVTSIENGDVKCPKTIEATIKGQTFTFTDENPCGDNNHNFKIKNDQGDNTDDRFICKQNEDRGINLDVPPKQIRDEAWQYTGEIDVFASKDTRKNCADTKDRWHVTEPIVASYDARGGPDGGGGAEGGATGGDECESNSVGDLLWILCPGLRLADKTAEGLNSFVNDQLCVNTGGSLTQGNQNNPCGGENILNDDVYKAWAIFKNLASAALIVIMLLIIYAQATGSTFLEAYSTRKALPRLVAAVILIQLSWVALKFLVDVSNDLGQGIQALLYAPFGGPDVMTLDSLMGKQLDQVVDTTEGKFALFAALAGSGITLVANIPGLMAMAILVILALFVAFFVLILRKVLIILLVILAPLALIAWILSASGRSERLWKTWSTNFSKLLLMYPLIMGIIAAGRIFAFIVASGGKDPTAALNSQLAVAHIGPLTVPHFATVTDFAGLVIILVAFFGPYLLLPKTFSWGGAMMGTAAGFVYGSKFAKSAQEKSSAAAKGWAERTISGRFAKKYTPTDKFPKRFAYSVLGGRLIPTPYRRALLTKKGAEWAAERDAEAEAVVSRSYEAAEKGEIKSGVNVRAYNRGTKQPEDARYDKGVAAAKAELVKLMQHPNERIAKKALQRFIKTASWPELQKLRTDSDKRIFDLPIWDKEIDNNPELYPDVQRARVDTAPHVKQHPSVTSATTERGKQVARLNNALTDYINPDNLPGQAQGFFQDIDEVADAGVSEKLARNLAAIAQAGQGSVSILSRMHDNGSLTDDVNFALSHYDANLHIQDFIEHARRGGGMVTDFSSIAGISRGATTPPPPTPTTPPGS